MMQALITIDNEVGESARNDIAGFQKYIIGKVDSEKWGTPRIVKMLQEHGVKGEFFTDIYECKRFGEDIYARHCNWLLEQEQGLQLHTHPGYAFDEKRRNMYEYTLEEQKKIVQYGIEKIECWTKCRPIAHRAGMYGADKNTLLALAANGIEIDSSYFHQHPNCMFAVDDFNHPSLVHGVIEIPITVRESFPKIKGFPIPIKLIYKKLDVNHMSTRQMTRAIRSLKGKVTYLIIFLHSSSFIKRQGNGKISVDQISFRLFRTVLRTLVALGIHVTTFKEIQQTIGAGKDGGTV